MSSESQGVLFFLFLLLLYVYFYRLLYSVMQSDGNSFFLNVDLNNVNMAIRDKNSIIDQNEKLIFSDINNEDFTF